MQTRVYWKYIMSLCTALPVIYNSLTISSRTISVQSTYVCVCVSGFPNCFSSQKYWWYVIFSVVHHPLVGQGLLNIETSQSHSGGHATLCRTPLDGWSVRRRDLYLKQHSQETDIDIPGWIWIHIPSKLSAADLRTWIDISDMLGNIILIRRKFSLKVIILVKLS